MKEKLGLKKFSGKKGTIALPAWAYFLLFAVVVTGVKLFLMRDVHIWAITNSPADDQLMVKLADKLYHIRWLGHYDSNTLVKGMFFPLFLATCRAIHLDYISAVQIGYAVSCFLFLWGIRPLIRKQWVLYLLFVLLSLCAIMFSRDAVQRVYRNSITPMQVMLVFGGFFAMYLRRKEPLRKWLGWSLVTAAGLLTFWLTREDAIWILPFTAVVTVVLVCSCLQGVRKRFKENRKQTVQRAIAVCLPVLCLWAGIQFISMLNGVLYGVWTDNELNGSHFKDTMQALYAVDVGGESSYVSITREKLRKVYEVSPTMASIQDSLEAWMDAWAKVSGREEENKENLEVENGWFFWVLRDAVSSAGYYVDAKTADAFYEQAAKEINQAMDDGLLKRQAVMPSALMAPWQEGMLGDLLETMGEITDYVMTWERLYLVNGPATGDQVELFEETTLRKSYTMEEASDPSVNEHDNGVLNAWVSFWRPVNIVGTWLGRAGFVLLAVLWLTKKAGPQEKVFLLFLAGMAGGLICLYAGVAYNHLRSCESVDALYLSGAYPLEAAFQYLALAGSLQWLLPILQKRLKKQHA